MSAPKKILQKRNRTQAETIADLMEENRRLTKENNRFAEFVRASRSSGVPLVFFKEWDDVIERAEIRGS